MLIKTGSIIAVLILSTYASATSAQNRASSFENFKREMMPQVGKKITVVGVLKSGKLGWLLAFKGWGVYIYSVRDSDISKMNYLNRFAAHTVEVTGTLRYFPEPASSNSDRIIVARPPEHFYFDVADVIVVDLNPPRSKRLKKNRRKTTSMLNTPPNNTLNRSANSTAFIRKT